MDIEDKTNLWPLFRSRQAGVGLKWKQGLVVSVGCGLLSVDGNKEGLFIKGQGKFVAGLEVKVRIGDCVISKKAGNRMKADQDRSVEPQMSRKWVK
jgi:hypothetical protein